MSDLVKRLRVEYPTREWGVVLMKRLISERSEAADRLEALQAENERLREALEVIANNPVNMRRAVDCHRTARAALGGDNA